jgi:hypothetical protein
LNQADACLLCFVRPMNHIFRFVAKAVVAVIRL